MKTFFEHFLAEVVHKQEAGELDVDKAPRWIAEMQRGLHEYPQHDPAAPVVQMPVRH